MSDSPQHDRDSFGLGGIDADPPVRSLTFDTDEETYVAEFDGGDVSPSVAVISVVAKITGQSVTALRPLDHVVDPDALDRIVRHRPSGPSRNDRLVEFTYEGLTIQLSSGGVIEVGLPRAGNTE
ncbi:HalOD1 output domain-containing protein [Haloplanus natans]|uniref:HalOD1 output domain-containing protein n=1 Tax=Haloplanus natans TaxID=376171 RepID=UPI0006783484